MASCVAECHRHCKGELSMGKVQARRLSDNSDQERKSLVLFVMLRVCDVGRPKPQTDTRESSACWSLLGQCVVLDLP